MNKPFFNSNYEKYEWLISNGCTNSEDRIWLNNYIKTDEYTIIKNIMLFIMLLLFVSKPISEQG